MNIILVEIAAVTFVILLGWLLQHLDPQTARLAAPLSRIVVDVALPAMILGRLLETTSAEALARGWFLPIAGALILLLGGGLGMLAGHLFCKPHQRSTFTLLTLTPNWVYMPLPIIAALHGDAGIQAILLINVGALIVLWTAGVAVLQGRRPSLQALRDLATNPGLVATLLGVSLALALPGLAHLAKQPAASDASILDLLSRAGLKTLSLVGSLTIPLSLLATGLHLGSEERQRGLGLASAGVALIRLGAVPACVVGALLAAQAGGWSLPREQQTALLLVAAMPPAVSCGLFVERFGGDPALAAHGIVTSTLLSLASVPLWFWTLSWASGTR